MKKAVVLLFALISTGVMAQGVKTPAPSPTQTIKQDFALSSIEITYSRPAAKGRKIFGDLVPFGKIWRTGANAATKVTFGEDVKVGGVPVKAGSYAIYSVPDAKEWEIIINKGANNSGLTGYKTEDDVARFKVETGELPMMIENFTIILGNLTASSAAIQILWEHTAVEIPVVADIDSKIMAQINTAMTVDSRPYYQAASYYFDNGKDINKALEWATKAAEAQPTAYWVMHLKAKVQAKAGDKAGAKASAMKSMEMAKQAKNDDYVVLNQKLIATL